MNGMNVDHETDKCNLLDADALGSVISHKAKRCGCGIRRAREETHTHTKKRLFKIRGSADHRS